MSPEPVMVAADLFTLAHPREVFLGFLIFLLLAPALLWALFRSARRGTRRIRGKGKVLYPRSVRALVQIAWLMVIALPLAGKYHGELPTTKDTVLAMVILGLMLLPLHLEVFRFSVNWDGYWIYTNSPWRRRRRIPVSSVLSCSYSHLLQLYRIETRKSGSIHISAYASGTPDLLALLPVETPPYPPRFLPWSKPMAEPRKAPQ